MTVLTSPVAVVNGTMRALTAIAEANLGISVVEACLD